jgi:5'-3' exonuclease
VSDHLLLLDSASLYFRAFFGVKESITAPDGTPVNAVRGFLDMVATLVSRRRPDRLVACWDDDWRPAFRVAALPSYKAHRVSDAATGAEESPPALNVQVPIIIEVLAALGIARVGATGMEADDVIGVLATRAVTAARTAATAADVDIVTGDRDLFQLVDDAQGVRVLYTGRGVRNLQVVDQAHLRTSYGVDTGDAYAEMAVLRGDASDGLPGVAGIGEKTAASLLVRFGSLAAVRAAAAAGDSRLSPAVLRRLVEGANYLDRAPGVVRVLRDGGLPRFDDALPLTPPDHQHLQQLATRWNLESSVARVVTAMSA